jgi:hypothetical protein
MNRFSLSRSSLHTTSAGLWLAMLVVAALFAACSGDELGDDDSGSSGPPPPPDPVTVCETSCGETNVAGKADYDAYRECLLCDACAHACGAATGCKESVENPPCVSAGTDCAICSNSMCAGGQNKDTTFSGHCAVQGETCAKNLGCVGMNNCVVSCLASGGSGGAGGAGGSGGAGAGGS